MQGKRVEFVVYNNSRLAIGERRWACILVDCVLVNCLLLVVVVLRGDYAEVVGEFLHHFDCYF